MWPEYEMKVLGKGVVGGGGQEDGEVLGERWGRGGGEEVKSMDDELRCCVRKQSEHERNRLADSSAAFSLQVGCNDKRILVP